MRMVSDIERLRNNAIKRRERLKRAREIATHTKEQWEAIKKEFEYRCVRCGRGDCYIEKDHIIPIYAGGSDGIDNLQPLCAWCNSGKGPDDFNWAVFRRKHGWDKT
jgi:5-methylcytosine-specific restriction endonuclease McrA